MVNKSPTEKVELAIVTRKALIPSLDQSLNLMALYKLFNSTLQGQTSKLNIYRFFKFKKSMSSRLLKFVKRFCPFNNSIGNKRQLVVTRHVILKLSSLDF